MTMRYLITLGLLLLLAGLHLQIDTELALDEQWKVLRGVSPESFPAYQFYYSALPRVAMALLVGGALGVTGSLLQQLLNNNLVSPMTLGAASGAWLGLVAATLYAPLFAAGNGHWAALGGALAATTLVLVIAGRRGLTGLPVVLAGMAVNLLLGAIASALVLLNDQYARNLFIWGAGDLAQTDWSTLAWLLPRLLPLPLLLLLAPRPLTLLRLGEGAAQGRGLSLLPLMVGLLLLGLWLTSVAITAVGLIGFIGLLTPNLARLIGTRSARDELLFSLLLGALLLLATDALALLASHWSTDLVPSGAAAALIGAPALIWLARQRVNGERLGGAELPGGRARLHSATPLLIGAALAATVVLSLGLAPGGDGWSFAWPQGLLWELRWPRLLAAAAAGIGLAVAGVVLQRLIRNPLASPDILGLSAGATLALVLSVMFFGGTLRQAGPAVAFAGSLTILGLLILLGRRHRYAPGIMALIGISLAALLDAVVQFSLARGSQDATALLGWLAGSTYAVSDRQALLLSAGVLVACGLALLTGRALTLITIGDGFAAARGLSLGRARTGLLVLVAVICALVTAVLGPIAFVGLLAPHMATLLGARRVTPQLLLAAALGLLLMLGSDWLGRVLIYPLQVPAGIVASVIGGSYFVALLARRRLS